MEEFNEIYGSVRLLESIENPIQYDNSIDLYSASCTGCRSCGGGCYGCKSILNKYE